ncbi:MAG: hypothetical protein HYV48_03390 [Candidatus Omnitrophica bacterium]|nr:hypothetical protein [Candidatus Omnitrophota bacterium]
MEDKTKESNEIFPKDPDKTYGLMEVVKGTTPLVEKEPEDTIFTFPWLIIKEVICCFLVIAALAIISIYFDAPLEELANPSKTPNPAKAPWYFLGLQEMLHYFPPVVAGVLLPTLIVIALIVIPYFEINIKREGLWKKNREPTLLLLFLSVLAVSIFLWRFHVWPVIIPTWLITVLMLIPLFLHEEKGIIGWFSKRSPAEWIMAWFILVAVTLTIIGVFFRGPGWEWVWPWKEGLYYSL